MEPLQCENDFLGELFCKIHKTRNSIFLSLVLFTALHLLMQGMLGLKQSMGEIASEITEKVKMACVLTKLHMLLL